MKKIFLSFFIFFASGSVFSQPYKNLVFEGAGIRGIAYAGAIRELEENNIIRDIQNVAGTSAGGITALCIALGYNAGEIENIIYSTRFNKFNDGRFIFIGGFYRLIKKYGWYRGKSFTRWTERIIEDKTGDANITFAQLRDRGYKNLYLTGVSLNNQKLIVFSHSTYPQMKVKDAVRITMSIPLYFRPVYIDSAGTTVKKPDCIAGYDLMVDGGITANFPIFIFDSLGSSARFPNEKTLGLRIDSELQIEYDLKNKGLAPYEVEDFKSYISGFYNYVIENLNRSVLTAPDWDRTISISSGDIGPKVRKLSSAEKDLLISNGAGAVKRYFNEKYPSEN